MYVFTNLQTEETLSISEEDMKERIKKKCQEIVGEGIPVDVKQVNITNALVDINGRPATVDFHLIFPKSEIEFDNYGEERARKIMGDANVPWI